MGYTVLAALANNAARLLVLSTINGICHRVSPKYKRFLPYLRGLLAAIICFFIMSEPFSLQPGVVFDPRSILISVTALIFGAIPAFIVVASAVAVRLFIGGAGVLPGLAIIAASASIGLGWRRWLYPKRNKWRLLNIYGMGVAVQAITLLCVLLLPSPHGGHILRGIALPLMTVYPVATVLLGILLIRQEGCQQMQAQLRESEERFEALFEKAPLGYQSLDSNGNLVIVNQQWLDTLGYSRFEVIGRWFGDFLPSTYQAEFSRNFSLFKACGKMHSDFEMLHKNGNSLHISFEGKVAYGPDGKFLRTHCILQDITEQKKAQEELIYISNHDILTGVYNRHFFELEAERIDASDELPVSIIMADINGLKLINDSFGRALGDEIIIEAARLLQSCCREDDIIARTGGDEFCILMPKTDRETAMGILATIQATRRIHNRGILNEAHHISISLGTDTKETHNYGLMQICINAEDRMNRCKLLERKSSRSAIISSIKATMQEKSMETEEHAERIATLCRKVGIKAGLDQANLDRMELLATLHDIGKIGIDERILNKPDKLNMQEWDKIQKHPEIGYRIAMSSPELAQIADDILYHHERYDGTGYPENLAGDDIPLLSRILAVIDAYDVMTQGRPYRKARSHDEAIEEIRKNSGTQFDPQIASKFIETFIKC